MSLSGGSGPATHAAAERDPRVVGGIGRVAGALVHWQATHLITCQMVSRVRSDAQ